jgi:pantoate--beta-alanine ligase
MRQFASTDFQPEYIEIVDGRTLLPLESFYDTDYAVVCAAVWLEKVRLIDNLILKAPTSNT